MPDVATRGAVSKMVLRNLVCALRGLSGLLSIFALVAEPLQAPRAVTALLLFVILELGTWIEISYSDALDTEGGMLSLH